MTDEPFGRQPQPVRLYAFGDLTDIEHYLTKIKTYIEHSSYDNVERAGTRTIIIYPRAIND